MRWRAIHHDRLVALDAGDCANPQGDNFKARFQRRELENFPRLPDLAFVSTSDAYALDEVGRRFAWIRMAEPSTEALRQAFLDHESRILCDWSPALTAFPDANPNNVRHAWISSVQLAGTLQLFLTFVHRAPSEPECNYWGPWERKVLRCRGAEAAVFRHADLAQTAEGGRRRIRQSGLRRRQAAGNAPRTGIASDSRL